MEPNDNQRRRICHKVIQNQNGCVNSPSQGHGSIEAKETEQINPKQSFSQNKIP